MRAGEQGVGVAHHRNPIDCGARRIRAAREPQPGARRGAGVGRQQRPSEHDGAVLGALRDQELVDGLFPLVLLAVSGAQQTAGPNNATRVSLGDVKLAWGRREHGESLRASEAEKEVGF